MLRIDFKENWALDNSGQDTTYQFSSPRSGLTFRVRYTALKNTRTDFSCILKILNKINAVLNLLKPKTYIMYHQL